MGVGGVFLAGFFVEDEDAPGWDLEDDLVEAEEGVDLILNEVPGIVLHLCTLNLRFANLSLDSSSARISSTHSLSYGMVSAIVK